MPFRWKSEPDGPDDVASALAAGEAVVQALTDANAKVLREQFVPHVAMFEDPKVRANLWQGLAMFYKDLAMEASIHAEAADGTTGE